MQIKPFFKFKLGDVLKLHGSDAIVSVYLLDQIKAVYTLNWHNRDYSRKEYGRSEVETSCYLAPKLIGILYAAI